MPAPHPAQFREEAVELARERAKPMAVQAKDLGIIESCLRNWMAKADVEDGEDPSVRKGVKWACGACGTWKGRVTPVNIGHSSPSVSPGKWVLTWGHVL